MNTRNSLLSTELFRNHATSVLERRDFRAYLEMERLRKPKIRKMCGVPVWFCRCVNPGALNFTGFGATPAEAYRDWKKSCLSG